MTIGVGAWLGTIMLFNVWVLIWPNQKKILGIVAATDEEKAKARKVALYASRTNFVLSVPMLMCMARPEPRPAVLTALSLSIPAVRPELGHVRARSRTGPHAKTFTMPADRRYVSADRRRALAEDVGAGDLTAQLIPAERTGARHRHHARRRRAVRPRVVR